MPLLEAPLVRFVLFKVMPNTHPHPFQWDIPHLFSFLKSCLVFPSLASWSPASSANDLLNAKSTRQCVAHEEAIVITKEERHKALCILKVAFLMGLDYFPVSHMLQLWSRFMTRKAHHINTWCLCKSPMLGLLRTLTTLVVRELRSQLCGFHTKAKSTLYETGIKEKKIPGFSPYGCESKLKSVWAMADKISGAKEVRSESISQEEEEGYCLVQLLALPYDYKSR